LADYAEHYSEFKHAGAEVVAISVDDRNRAAAMAADLNLPFPILSDTRRETITAWGVLNRFEKGGIAEPACFVIDRDRKVRFRSPEGIATRVSAGEMASYVRAIAANQQPVEPRARLVNPGMMFLRSVANAIRRGTRVPFSRS
jgi:peroxiredoxin